MIFIIYIFIFIFNLLHFIVIAFIHLLILFSHLYILMLISRITKLIVILNILWSNIVVISWRYCVKCAGIGLALVRMLCRWSLWRVWILLGILMVGFIGCSQQDYILIFMVYNLNCNNLFLPILEEEVALLFIWDLAFHKRHLK